MWAAGTVLISAFDVSFVQTIKTVPRLTSGESAAQVFPMERFFRIDRDMERFGIHREKAPKKAFDGIHLFAENENPFCCLFGKF